MRKHEIALKLLHTARDREVRKLEAAEADMDLFNSRLAYDKEIGNERDRAEHEAKLDAAMAHAAEARQRRDSLYASILKLEADRG